MVSTIVIDSFLSRECKSSLHQDCHGKWYGLGFEVSCSCNCHLNKKALEVAPNPATNATIKELPKEEILLR